MGGCSVGGGCSAKRTGEGRLLWEGGVDVVVDGLVNYSLLKKILKFL